MAAPDLSYLHGKPVEEAVRIGERFLHQARQQLREAHAVFSLCAQQTRLSPFTIGQLQQQIWQAELGLGLHRQYFSQAGQDRFVHEAYFANHRGGVFVEIGGYNGVEGSNCLFFEKFLGWSGLVVEASPTQVARLRPLRDATVVHAAIADVDGTAEFIDITTGKTQMSGLAAHYPPGQLERLQAEPGNTIERVEVPVMRLDTLLRAHQLNQVDYCSIDVEGAEPIILQSFDFSAFAIRVFSVENSSHQPTSPVQSLFTSGGYTQTALIGHDEIYLQTLRHPSD